MSNVKRHTERRHKIAEGNDFVVSNNDAQKVGDNAQTVGIDPQTVAKNAQSVLENTQLALEVAKPALVCDMCNKSYTSKFNLKRHIQTCTGKKSPYECELCRKPFDNKHKKYYHKQSCTGKINDQVVPITEASSSDKRQLSPFVVNNNGSIDTVQNINTQNVQNIQNVQNNQTIQYITVNLSSDDPIVFITDHMEDPVLLNAIFSKSTFDEMFHHLFNEIMKNEKNRIGQKFNLSRNITVIFDNMEWRVCKDDDIIHVLQRGVATAALLLKQKLGKQVKICTDYITTFKNLQTDAEQSITEARRNGETISPIMRSTATEIKGLLYRWTDRHLKLSQLLQIKG